MRSPGPLGCPRDPRINNPTSVIVGAITALATIPLFKTGTLAVMQRHNLIQLSDAAGMALFVVTGTNVALAAGADNLAAAIVGVIAGPLRFL